MTKPERNLRFHTKRIPSALINALMHVLRNRVRLAQSALLDQSAVLFDQSWCCLMANAVGSNKNVRLT
jgi:hypothetical protein